MTKKNGGPAFPRPVTEWNAGQPGMTLRDWFAGQALAGIMAGWPANERISEARAAEISYHAADAMIAERGAQ